MKKRLFIFGALMLVTLCQRSVLAGTIYNSIPGPLPGNVPSWGYQATQTAEFGELIRFAPGTSRNLWEVTAVMSDWALAATYGSSDAGWYHDITLNLYNVDDTGTTPQHGSLIQSVTQNFFIPWRPVASAGCGTAWLGTNGTCYNGLAFEVSFHLDNITVPDQLIYGIAFNTNTWGLNPIGSPGPYESLNFGLNTAAPTVGSLPLPNAAYRNSSTGGTFQQVTGSTWTQYNGTVAFVATPEPGTVGLMLGGGLMILVGSVRRKKQSKQ